MYVCVCVVSNRSEVEKLCICVEEWLSRREKLSPLIDTSCVCRSGNRKTCFAISRVRVKVYVWGNANSPINRNFYIYVSVLLLMALRLITQTHSECSHTYTQQIPHSPFLRTRYTTPNPPRPISSKTSKSDSRERLATCCDFLARVSHMSAFVLWLDGHIHPLSRSHLLLEGYKLHERYH